MSYTYSLNSTFRPPYIPHPCQGAGPLPPVTLHAMLPEQAPSKTNQQIIVMPLLLLIRTSLLHLPEDVLFAIAERLPFQADKVRQLGLPRAL